jgi:transcription elongation factor Elf1
MDIGRQTIKLNCPTCKRQFSVSLRQVANEETVKCICGQQTQLKDNNHSGRRAIGDINQAFKDIERTFKNIGR